jgi:DeoR/GlpR family transcriptional regulator of sugar metabolism
VRLITHSVALLEAAFHGEASILCLGGELRKVSGALTGGNALNSLAMVHADLAFIGASGVDPAEGCSTTELSEAEMKKALLARASRKVLLADQTKWRNPSTIRFAAWSNFQDWITDQAPARKETSVVTQAGVRIHEA